jgi:hypothetical protein
MNHGKASTYNDRGCRCGECRAAHARSRAMQRKRTYLRHGSPALVSTLGAKRRVQALQAIGWSMNMLETRLGRSRSYLSALMTRDSMTPATFEAIADLYDQLSMTPGTSRRAIGDAKRGGFVPPLAWDDIDNDEAPSLGDRDDEIDEIAVERLMTGRRVPATWAEIREAARRLSAQGLSDATVAELVGASDRSIIRWRKGLAA